MSTSSSSMSNPDGNNNNNSIRPLESKRKKRRKIVAENSADESATRNRWRTDSARQIYSVKLIEALRQTRRSSAAAGGVVRETADRVLAVSAKGRTRWSRSILTNQLRLKHSQIKRQHKKAKVAGGVRPKPAAERRRLPVLQKKVQVLGKLVPGCRKLSFPSLLEEATDYIAALEMQVRAMTALAGLLSGGEPSNLS